MKKNNKGFTLAELLIVVAIIAVLVAIAIPIFTTQLEKSKEGTDVANLRSAYAAGTVAALTGQYGANTISGGAATLYFNPSVDGSLDSSGVAIGQGTATDGKYDLSGIGGGAGVIKYDKGNVVGNKIKVTISSGVVTSVEFAS